MKKSIVYLCLALGLAAFAVQQGIAAGKGKADCTIVKVEKNIVTLDCGETAKNLRVGKPAKVREKPEGC